MSDDDKTLELLRQLVESQPDNWGARAHLATLLLERGDAAGALALVQALRLPEDGEAQHLVGRILGAADPGRALEHYRAMVARDRRDAQAHLALAHLYRDRGLREDARHHYGIAVVIDESLEDEAFDAWIHGDAPSGTSPRPGVPEAPPPLPSASDLEDDAPDPHADVGDAPTAEELQEVLDVDGGSAPKLPRVSFEQVGGMDELKERVRMHVVYPFKNPALFKKFKKRPGGGILLYGPPGCGKTYMARATAGECDARFLSVGVADVLSRWLGESERRLAEIFHTARRHAPTVVFVDELDALGMNRRDARGSALTTTINQLLTELDGIHASNENLMVLAATNAPWSVDNAFRRPGRFDRVIFVPPPDEAARQAILEIHLRDIPHETPDLAALARATEGFSGADLRAVVERAAEEAITQEMRTGKSTLITRKMLLKAAKGIKPSTREWLDTARSYASFSNRGGQYDDVARWLEEHG